MSQQQEVERKFLVKELPDLANADQTSIRQGYLTQPDDSVEVRIRQKGSKYFMTLKSGEGLVRNENEMTISEQQFVQLWPNTIGQRVEKTRWKGKLDNNLCFELDVFEGALAPLRLVEVEFESVEQTDDFEVPTWFGQDVTHIKGYKNKALATDGIPLIA
ncbi:CYTH domain-containing protein [Neiella marina]|uniref:CYTH domain-containing protein n=1 Tax=Neiella holothuriorum TaxID=2870530 RepID=A0ABS7EDB4_9GAMM|nr:CYTH domain-containing protein [Neiella holothuriorum]MBW8190245.1 CYTH domain-containing protein [Neiella holothuriorum]